MQIDSEIIEELKLLMRYRMTSTPAGGIDIGQAADPAAAAAAMRLFNKGIIERVDGGALTDSGRETVDHMTRLFSRLSPPLEPI